MTDAQSRYDKMARLNRSVPLDPYYSRHDNDIRDSNPIATAGAFAALLLALGMCLWASMGSCDLHHDGGTVAAKTDAAQVRMEAIAWARHYEDRGRK